MEVLRNLFGNLTSGIIRLGVTVGILAAVYFFIVHPALDATTKISKEANDSFEKSFKQGFGGNGAGPVDVQKTIREVNAKVQREIRRSFHVAHIAGGPASPKKLVKCIRRADGNVHKIQTCTVKF